MKDFIEYRNERWFDKFVPFFRKTYVNQKVLKYILKEGIGKFVNVTDDYDRRRNRHSLKFCYLNRFYIITFNTSDVYLAASGSSSFCTFENKEITELLTKKLLNL